MTYFKNKDESVLVWCDAGWCDRFDCASVAQLQLLGWVISTTSQWCPLDRDMHPYSLERRA